MKETWTLKELYQTSCSQIPNEPGVYYIVAPSGMQIEFHPISKNISAPCYEVEKLRTKGKREERASSADSAIYEIRLEGSRESQGRTGDLAN